MRLMLKSKICKATVTSGSLEYEGSITIGKDLMGLVDLWEGEQVLVVDNTNGARLFTYAIAGLPGSIVMNGAASHLIKTGDEIIIMAFAMTEKQIRPRTILVKNNQFVRRIS